MRERGRENGSFPVAETLKPLGFKEPFWATRRCRAMMPILRIFSNGYVLGMALIQNAKIKMENDDVKF
jgi:hypothetical protein